MTTTVNVAGKERIVKFPVMSLIRLKKEAGIDLSALQGKDEMQDIETIVALIWAGLVTDDPSLTREFLAENMEIHELNEVAQTVMSVINQQVKKDQVSQI